MSADTQRRRGRRQGPAAVTGTAGPVVERSVPAHRVAPGPGQPEAPLATAPAGGGQDAESAAPGRSRSTALQCFSISGGA